MLKNTVDSESIAQVLHQRGMSGVGDPESAEVMIVNTCGFINSAKEESIDALRELVEIKRADQMVIAAGCLSQRYGDTLVQEVPGLDGVIGTRRWMDILISLRGFACVSTPNHFITCPLKPRWSAWT